MKAGQRGLIVGAVVMVLLAGGAFAGMRVLGKETPASPAANGPAAPPTPTEAPKPTPLMRGRAVDARGRGVPDCYVELMLFKAGHSGKIDVQQTADCTADGSFQLTFSAGQSLTAYTGESGEGDVTFMVHVRRATTNDKIPFSFTHRVAHDARGNFYFPPEPDGSYAFPVSIKFDFGTGRSTPIL